MSAFITKAGQTNIRPPVDKREFARGDDEAAFEGSTRISFCAFCASLWLELVVPSNGYKIVRLANGVHSVHSLAHGETFHPAIGPVAEAEALYVKQLRLVERVREQEGEFVIWDVGLGAAANALAVLRSTRHLACAIRLVSFDNTTEPLQFFFNHAKPLGYFRGFPSTVLSL